MSNDTRTTRPTLASTNARIDALVTANTETLGLLARLVERMDAAGQFATPATVAQITDAPSYDAEQANREPSHAGKRSRKGGRKISTNAAPLGVSVVSFAQASVLVDAGADPASVLVFGGKFGKGEPQTFADAKARRDANEAKRAAYVAERKAQPSERKAERKANRAQVAADTAAIVKATTPAQASASLIGMTGAQLVALGTDAANAEIARRAAKRAARKGA